MKKSFAIIIMCCALSLSLAACSGRSTAPAASDTVSSLPSEDATAKQAAEAQAALDEGLGYWFGTGATGYNKEKARAALREAADAGNAEGWYWLGVIAQEDTSADRWPEVIGHYQKAADNGCAKGWCGLGDLYRTGYGFEKDVKAAQDLYQKAADAGELLGDLKLGFLYEKGIGVEASESMAVSLYDKGLSSDEFFICNEARCDLGELYYHGAGQLEADPVKALSYYQAAADEGYPRAWGGLSFIYAEDGHVFDQGISIEVNEAKAAEYDAKAAELGFTYNLGLDYEMGWGVEQDYAKAAELYQQQIDSGRDPALGMIGMAGLYCYGEGVEEDRNKAADLCYSALAAAGPDDDQVVSYSHELLDWIANHS